MEEEKQETKVGFIYKIKNGTDDACYVGSTVLPIQQRLYYHMKSYGVWLKSDRTKRNCASYELFDKYGVDNCTIELLQVVPYEDKKEVRVIEDEWIRNTEQTLNKNRACINKQQHLDSMKAWRVMNKEYNTSYLTQKVLCDCGKEISLASMSLHKKTKYHVNNLKTKEENKDEEKQEKPYKKIETFQKCGCGITVKTKEFSSHRKTMVHTIWLQAEKAKQLQLLREQQTSDKK